jgi:hypothetical protein
MAPGELLDKITILEIKLARMDDPAKQRHVLAELTMLREVRAAGLPEVPGVQELVGELHRVNAALWDVEDEIRDCERRQDFGPRFIELARLVYRQNDHRAAVKRQLNELLGSTIIEEKSYAAYAQPPAPERPV